MKPASPEAYQLFHEGVVALADVERNGIRIDVRYLEKQIADTSAKIKRGEEHLKQSSVWKRWKQKFRGKAKIGSKEQLASLFFGEMGYKCQSRTGTGRYKADEAAFAAIDHPFVRNFFKVEKLKKVHGTYLKGIQRELCGEFLHPFFNLHTVRTYRGSSDRINFQNIPIRNPSMGKTIRQAFIPRDGHVIVEIDYGGIEVCIAACYHKDPAMIRYIKDPTKDMHRDMAAKCFLCDNDQVSKAMRYCGKNMFVFPEFYGSFWRDCAEALWNALTVMNLEMADGTSVKAHLASKGFTELGDAISHYDDDRGSTKKQGKGSGRIEAANGYYRHISDLEQEFWRRTFPVYAQWKKDWVQEYRTKGYYHTLTGFRIAGYYGRNDVINHPVQGTAFHCLLWSLIRLNKWLRKNKMRSMIVGQIHDSIVADVHASELEDYLAQAKYIMTEAIMNCWRWICVPLSVEAEVTPEGGSWNDKKAREI